MTNSIDATGHKLSFFEALALGLILYTLNSAMWSDEVYNDAIRYETKISELLYQKIGIFITIFLIVIMFGASYKGHGYGTIYITEGILSSIILYLILTIIIGIISTKNT